MLLLTYAVPDTLLLHRPLLYGGHKVSCSVCIRELRKGGGSHATGTLTAVLISQRSPVLVCARLSKGKGDSRVGGNRQVSTLLCARAASAQIPSLRKRPTPDERIIKIDKYP